MPRSDSERAAVRLQMERILSHDLFKHSRRYPVLFRYIVERTLDDVTDRLKERTLGIEVFGREADYDTNLDPVVRTTAGEIRKRIAQYYHEPGHAAEIRIDLPVGSYVPEFQPPAEPETVVPTARPWHRRMAAATTAAGLIAVCPRGPPLEPVVGLEIRAGPILGSDPELSEPGADVRRPSQDGAVVHVQPGGGRRVSETGDPIGRVRPAEPERRTFGRDDPLPAGRFPADEGQELSHPGVGVHLAHQPARGAR